MPELEDDISSLIECGVCTALWESPIGRVQMHLLQPDAPVESYAFAVSFLELAFVRNWHSPRCPHKLEGWAAKRAQLPGMRS